MDQLIVQVGEKSGRTSELVRSNGDLLRVGRGFTNDVVVSDLYVDPEQIVFSRSEDGWVVKVVGSTNPVLLNGGAIDRDGSRINSGDRITVGRTQLRVYSSDHMVEPTHQMVMSSWLGYGRAHPIFALFMMAFLLASVMFVSYQELSTELQWNQLFLEALYAGLMILVWSGIWALIGRLLRHQPNFTIQLGLTALITGVSTLVVPLGDYVEYAANSMVLGEIATWLIILLTTTALFRANLMFATNLKQYTRIAAIAAASILLVSFATKQFGKDEFDYQPEYSAVLKPPFTHLTPDRGVHEFEEEFRQKFGEVDQWTQEK